MNQKGKHRRTITNIANGQSITVNPSLYAYHNYVVFYAAKYLIQNQYVEFTQKCK
jgi:hypothetical protein